MERLKPRFLYAWVPGHSFFDPANFPSAFAAITLSFGGRAPFETQYCNLSYHMFVIGGHWLYRQVCFPQHKSNTIPRMAEKLTLQIQLGAQACVLPVARKRNGSPCNLPAGA